MKRCFILAILLLTVLQTAVAADGDWHYLSFENDVAKASDGSTKYITVKAFPHYTSEEKIETDEWLPITEDGHTYDKWSVVKKTLAKMSASQIKAFAVEMGVADNLLVEGPVSATVRSLPWCKNKRSKIEGPKGYWYQKSGTVADCSPYMTDVTAVGNNVPMRYIKISK